jgi:hypothetical protein
MYLSKSQYIRGLQCVKSLWLKKYRSDQLTPPDSSAEATFEVGNRVGELACQLFPNGKEVPFDGTTFDEKIALTQQWIDEGVQNIYEASFSFDGIFIMIDILHRCEDGRVEIYEVKSSTEVKEVYLHDASVQHYVLEGLGFDVKATHIVHLNNQYVREQQLDIQQLFSIVNVSDEVKELQANIPAFLNHFAHFIDKKDEEPLVEIGEHCFKPYACDAMAYCWKDIPDYSVFNISRLKQEKKFALYQQGVITLDQISDISSFSLAQQIQIKAEQENKAIINSEAIRDFLETLTFPLYHLDFETFQQAIPAYEGIRPFMQIPFQYSLHVEHCDGGLEHYEFLGDHNSDPRYALAKQLVEDIPTDVTVLAYNMGFEKGVIKNLAKQFPEFEANLLAIHENIRDLMTPFQKKDYYTPAMKGSFSIKMVLPALVPSMQQAYKELDGVQNGGEAMQTFAKLATMDDQQEIKRLRRALLAYCKLDTLAMVRVLEKLEESVK